MVEQTPNLKLDLDAGTDYYNIGKFNGNFQKIDTFASTIGGEVDDFLQQLSLRYTKEEIDAFLANKVNKKQSITSGDISDVLARSSGFYDVHPTVTGMPFAAWWYISVVSNSSGSQSILASLHNVANNVDLYCMNIVNGAIGTWRKLVTAEPPQEYSMPFGSGFSEAGASKYWRTQDGIVHVKIKSKSTIAYGSGATIATLPEGFRPRRQESSLAKYDVSGANNYLAQINIGFCPKLRGNWK